MSRNIHRRRLASCTILGILAMAFFSCQRPPTPSNTSSVSTNSSNNPSPEPVDNTPQMTSSDSAQEGSIGPGRPVPLDERLIGEAGAVTFVILDTGSGIVTVGIWSNQQPALSEFYKKGRDSLAGAPIEIVGDDFLKVTPKAPLKPDLVKVKDYGVVPVPGLAFINQSGTILVTLSERQPPKGFIFIGQASVSMSNVRNWKNSKEPVLIREATDTRI